MFRPVMGAIALAVALSSALPAAAAAPSAFRAKGEVHNKTEGEAQDMSLVISFKAGHVRVETDSKDAGKSIMVATKGHDSVAMLDPGQKLVVRMKPSALRGADAGDTPSIDSMLDPTGFKAVIQKEGRKIGTGGAVLGHPTTLYERTKKGSTMKVWLADDLELPLKIQGRNSKGDQFNMVITAIDLHPTFTKTDFVETPPGYTEVKTETAKD